MVELYYCDIIKHSNRILSLDIQNYLYNLNKTNDIIVIKL